MFGLLFLYNFKFGSYDGIALASFERYTKIFQIGWLLVNINYALLVINTYFPNYRNKLFSISTTIFIISFLIIAPVYKINIDNNNKYHNSALHKKIEIISDELKKFIKPNDRLFVVWQNSNKLEIMMFIYELFPNMVLGGGFGEPYGEIDVWTSNFTFEELKKRISTNDFLLVAYYDNKFVKKYKNIFNKEISTYKPLVQYEICKGEFAKFHNKGCIDSISYAYLFKIEKTNNSIKLLNIPD